MDNLEMLKSQLKFAGLVDMPSDNILKYEIESAIQYINYRRNYKSPATTLAVAPLYARYIIPMCKSKILKTGADGQSSHSENGISRGYKSDGEYPVDIIRQIPWAVR